MGSTTGISWTDATWNPIRGCSRVSPGCVHCYAETVAARFSKPGQPYEGLTDRHGRWNGAVRFIEKHLHDPLRWQRPRKIFANSMSDIFHDGLAWKDLDRIFAVMALAQRHTFQLLTKRADRMHQYMNDTLTRQRIAAHVEMEGRRYGRLPESFYLTLADSIAHGHHWPLLNVWQGVSTEDQERAEERIPLLLRTPAVIRWISAEPLLGSLDLTLLKGDGYWINSLTGAVTTPHGSQQATHCLRWVVVGGESGKDYRSMDPAWAEDIAAQCAQYSVPLFVKQDSGAKPGQPGRLSGHLWSRKQLPVLVRRNEADRLS